MGIAASIGASVMRVVRSSAAAIIGKPTILPAELVSRYPELARVRYRRGGLPARVGGWFLGQPSVAAITLWRTIWLAPKTGMSVELLLHEFRHVEQFERSAAFPILYVWETLRRGYHQNRFEVDARAYAAARVMNTRRSPRSNG